MHAVIITRIAQIAPVGVALVLGFCVYVMYVCKVTPEMEVDACAALARARVHFFHLLRWST